MQGDPLKVISQVQSSGTLQNNPCEEQISNERPSEQLEKKRRNRKFFLSNSQYMVIIDKLTGQISLERDSDLIHCEIMQNGRITLSASLYQEIRSQSYISESELKDLNVYRSIKTISKHLLIQNNQWKQQEALPQLKNRDKSKLSVKTERNDLLESQNRKKMSKGSSTIFRKQSRCLINPFRIKGGQTGKVMENQSEVQSRKQVKVCNQIQMEQLKKNQNKSHQDQYNMMGVQNLIEQLLEQHKKMQALFCHNI